MAPPPDLLLPVPGMNLTLHPDDGMFVQEYGPAAAWEHYLESGRTALRGIRAAMMVAGVEHPQVRRILDLPCGHGRILRVLQAAFPEAKITACDIDRGGVDFCAKTFGAEPVYSAQDPARIPIDGPFDLIWVGSLLTHLDAAKWPLFLARFRQWLSPHGICVFTAHGIGVVHYIEAGTNNYGLKSPQDLLRRYRRYGFDYQPYERGGHYGTSLAGVSWVAGQIAALPKTRLLMYAERGWHNHQDLIAFTPHHAEK